MEENDNHKESQNIPGRVKPEPQENQADPKHKPSIPETNVLENINTLKTIHNLPTDVLAEVFNNLTHTQKLISRLVCTEWNNQISLMLSKASYFSLTSVESHETLLESDVQWTKFRISDSGYTLTKNVKNSVTTLQLDISGLGRSEYVRFLTGFPHLTSLDVQIGEDKSDKSKQDYSVRGQTQARLLNEQFRKRAGKLKILSVTCPFRKYGCLKNFLEAFDDETMSLTELNITEQQSQPESRYGGIYDYNYDPITRVDDKRSPMLQIYSTISKSKQTLIALDLNFCSKYMANELFTDFISKLTSLENLKLQRLLIRPGSIGENTESNFIIHEKFLKTQMSTLKIITLPWSSGTRISNEFLRSLPGGVKSLENVHREHVIEDFFTYFKDLDSMSIVSGGTSMFNQPCLSLQKLHICLEEDDLPRDEADGFYRSLGIAFVNLMELFIMESGGYLSNRQLQIIIENFEQLRVLHINNGDSISDLGVTGVSEKYSQEMIETRILCIPSAPDIPTEHVIHGTRLTSLKMLEKLVLLGTTITDFGIYYGLGFGRALKYLTFGTTARVSDWGLHWLGAGNTGLETFDGSFSSERISPIGVENLRQQLPLLECTQKFKLLNDKMKR